MIDFHCHLDLYPNAVEVVKECDVRRVYVLTVTTTPSAWKGTAALVKGSERIRVALGLHPELAHQRKSELGLFESLLPTVRYVGEIGLDGTPELRVHWQDQVTVFRRILSACEAAGGRIMTIHSRRAVPDVLDMLAAHPHAGIPILHWYSGGTRDLRRAIDLGCWFSVGPAMIAGEKGRTLLAEMPRDRVLTETDGPFATVDGRAAMPWDVGMIVPYMGGVWEMGPDQAAKQLRDNLRRLVKLGVRHGPPE
jgi:TatD DNase family protein